MSKVIVNMNKDESADRTLKRLKSKLESEGIFDEMRARRFFESNADKKQRKARAMTKKKRIFWKFNPHSPSAPSNTSAQ